MRKEDLTTNESLRVYIYSLEASGEKLTEKEWREWIKKEAADYEEAREEEDIDLVVEVLKEDGFVKEK